MMAKKNAFQLNLDNITYNFVPLDPNPEYIRAKWFKDIKQLVKTRSLPSNKRRGSAPEELVLIENSPVVEPLDPAKVLLNIISDKELALFFREFMHKHYNNENLSFYLEVEELKSRTSDWQVSQKAQQIYDTYFTVGSEFEININFKLRRDLDNMLANPHRNMFDEIQKSVWEVMCIDSLPKFLASDLYKDFKADKKRRCDSNSGGSGRCPPEQIHATTRGRLFQRTLSLTRNKGR